jgi:hypothetical protein
VTIAPFVHVVGLDVQAGYEETFERWYTEEHLPGVLTRPGWLAAHRYRCLAGEPEQLVIFDLDVTASELADGVTASPLPNERIGRRVRDYHARTYRLIFRSGDVNPAPALVNVIRSEVARGYEDEFNRWYNEVHVPEILGCPGWRSARRYRCVDEDGVFLAVYDLEDEHRPFATPEYEAAVGWEDQVGRLRGYHGFRIYQLLGSATSPS